MSLGKEHEPAASRPLAISRAEMNSAIDQGLATPLSQSHGWLTRYLDAWWIEYEGGWLRVIDDVAGRELDQIAARLAEASSTISETRTDGGVDGPGADEDSQADSR
jgi:hypothetical protein